MRLIKLALLSTLALAACRGGGDDSGDDQPMPDAPPGGSVKVKDVQNAAMMKGTAIELRGVVVTAIDKYGDRTGDFFVQDVEGGAFSGVKVFGAPLDQVGGIAVGDLVDITNAEKDEFALTSDMTGRTVTEIKGAAGGMMTVTRKGPGTMPTPETVDAKAIAAMDKATREAEWEKWEGVLIKVVNARQIAAARSFGAAVDQREFRITGVARVQSVLADLPATAFGDCYASITGVGDYFFNDLVLPRSVDDIVGGGSGCNPMATTITQAQTIPNQEVVKLTDVFVTAVTRNKKSFWVSTSLTAAPNEGIFVFRGTGTSVVDLPATVVPGAKVFVNGAITEFQGTDMMGESVTQVSDVGEFNTGFGVTAAPTTPPVPVVGQTAAALNATATGEPYESVLVTLTNVKVNNVGTSPNFVGQLQQGATTFLSDDDIIEQAAGDVGKCFTMTGIWTFAAFSDAYGLLPITKTETPCP